MRFTLRRALVTVAVSALATTGLAVAQAPAASAAACSGTSGVTVIVDFASLGGGIKTMCAPGDPPSGLAALTGAGFTYAFVPRFPGFVCQINVKPNPCNGAPATAYWSYWHAPRHGAWTYSGSGAAATTPPRTPSRGGRSAPARSPASHPRRPSPT
jgi:hypothetical protein